MPAGAPFPSYPLIGGNLPELRQFFGSFNANAGAAVITGKGFTVTRVAGGVWDVKLTRKVGQVIGMFLALRNPSNSDSVVAWQNNDPTNQNFRIVTYTTTTPTDPGGGSVIDFMIVFMNVKLPKV